MQHLIQHQQERQQDWLREQQQAEQRKQVTKRQSNPLQRLSKPVLALFARSQQVAEFGK